VRKSDNFVSVRMPIVLKSGSPNLLEPSGPLIRLYRDCFLIIRRSF